MVVVGAGFGGLAVARALRRSDIDVTVVDANNFHTFQPLLYQVATAGLNDDDVAHPIRKVFHDRSKWVPWRRGDAASGRRSTVVVMGRVVDVDTGGRSVGLADGRSIPYDTLVLAAGAVTADFGVPGVDEYAFGLKSVDDATALRTHVLANFERAALVPDRVEPGALDVVICGGGPTGVEMAGGLAELYTRVLAADFPELPVADATITIVEMADRVLTPFSAASSATATRTLSRMGVELRLGTGVARVGPDSVELGDGSSIRAGTCVWAAGVKAHPIAAALGIELRRGGRIPVTDDLRVVGRDDVFAIGDIAAAPGRDGTPLPQVAQPAIQGGRHVAREIERRLDGVAVQPFRYVDKGSMATIGRHNAVAELANGWRLRGFVGWVSWLGLHLVYLMGFRNRLSVFVNWCWNYLTFDRASRLLRDGEVDADLDGPDLDGRDLGPGPFHTPRRTRAENR